MAAAALALFLSSRPATSLAMIAVIALLAASLVYQVHRAVGDLKRQSLAARQAARQAEQHYVDVLLRILGFVEARDRYWDGHSRRVGGLCGQIAARLGLDESRRDLLRMAGELHDIGLLAIPSEIRLQRSRLGAEAFRTIQTHPQISFEILKPLESLQEALPAVRYHHERMNGTGYPEGLTGEKIPLGARVVAVADAYDAMTHDRPYRPAMSSLAAIQELRRCCPHGYDPACVDALAYVVNVEALERILPSREQQVLELKRG